MEVLIDDHPRSVTATTVGGVLEEVRGPLDDTGRLVIEVVADGATWSQARILSGEAGTSTCDRLELTTADRAALVTDTLVAAGAALDEIRAIQKRAATLVDEGRLDAAMREISEAVALWSDVSRAATLAFEARRRTDLSGLQRCATSLSEHMVGLRAALATQDTVAVSDALLYDLPATIDVWRVLIDDLATPTPTKEEA